jgi:hypothetical protein
VNEWASLSVSSVVKHLAKRVREVEDALPTSCTWESSRLNEIAADLDGLATHLTDGQRVREATE